MLYRSVCSPTRLRWSSSGDLGENGDSRPLVSLEKSIYTVCSLFCSVDVITVENDTSNPPQSICKPVAISIDEYIKMVSLLVYFTFISSLFLSGYTAPTTIKRADGPGTPYQCASSYGAPNIKDTLLRAGADARGITPSSSFIEEM